MEQKKSKYDTNPLDPEVARSTEEAWGAKRSTGEASVSETGEMSAATRDIKRTPQQEARDDLGAEAPTRRYDYPNAPASYPSVFVPPVYEPPASQSSAGAQSGASIGGVGTAATAGSGAQASNQPPTSRPVANINLPENITLMLPYLPFPVVGAVIAAVLLYLVPRSEPRVRFHAAQGLALHLIVLVVSLVSGAFEDVLPGAARLMLSIASAAFSISAFIFLIVSMIRVYKGEPHVVTPLTDITRWLNEKIAPRK